MLQPLDIGWIAGMLEGEGSFNFTTVQGGKRNSIRAAFSITDCDIAFRFANLLGFGSMCTVQPQLGASKLLWRWECSGVNAAGLMMTIYSLMGERRQERIRELLTHYKSTKAVNQNRRRDSNHKTFDPSLPHYCSFKCRTIEERRTLERETKRQWQARNRTHLTTYMRAYRARTKHPASYV